MKEHLRCDSDVHFVAHERRPSLISGKVWLIEAEAVGTGGAGAHRQELAVHTADKVALRCEIQQFAAAAEALRVVDFLSGLIILPAARRVIDAEAVLAAEVAAIDHRLASLIGEVLQVSERVDESWLGLLNLDVDGHIDLLLDAGLVGGRSDLDVDV